MNFIDFSIRFNAFEIPYMKKSTKDFGIVSLAISFNAFRSNLKKTIDQLN